MRLGERCEGGGAGKPFKATLRRSYGQIPREISKLYSKMAGKAGIAPAAPKVADEVCALH